IVSSLVRPSSVRTRIHVVSVVRAIKRYGKPSPRAATVEARAGEAGAEAVTGAAAGGAAMALAVEAVPGRAVTLGVAATLGAAGGLASASGVGAAGGGGAGGRR